MCSEVRITISAPAAVATSAATSGASRQPSVPSDGIH